MVLPLLVAGGIGAALGGISNLLNKRKGGRLSYNNLNLDNISLQLERLGALPKSPARDAAIQQLYSSIAPLQEQSKQAYSSIMPSIGQYGQTAQGLIGKLGDVSSQYLTLGSKGANPYLTYYGDPGGTEARLSGINDQAINSAFNEYGTVGGEALGRIGQVMASNARQGILNSGANRRQMEAEQMRLRQAKNAAQAEGQKFLQGTMQQIFSNYNQGLQGQGQFLQGASNALAQAGNLAGEVPKLNMQAGQLLGQDYRNTLGLQSNMEQQGRNEQIQRQQENNALANQERLARYNQQLNQATTNWQGKNAMQSQTPNFIESMLGGATSAMGMGNLFGGGGSSGGSSSGGLSGIYRRPASSGWGGGGSLTYDRGGNNQNADYQGYYGY